MTVDGSVWEEECCSHQVLDVGVEEDLEVRSGEDFVSLLDLLVLCLGLLRVKSVLRAISGIRFMTSG